MVGELMTGFVTFIATSHGMDGCVVASVIVVLSIGAFVSDHELT